MQQSAPLSTRDHTFTWLANTSRRGVSGWMFLLVPAHPGRLRQWAVKRSCECVCVCALYAVPTGDIDLITHQPTGDIQVTGDIPSWPKLEFKFFLEQLTIWYSSVFS